MPRSSRHKSHKHRDRSVSVEEESHRSRKQRDEPADSSCGGRISWDPDPELERPTNLPLVPVSDRKDGVSTGNVEETGENGKKRKDRAPETSDRWNGDVEERRVDGIRSKLDSFGGLNGEKVEKVKISYSDSKSKSSRRHDCSSERKEEGGVRDEPSKRRFDKESSQKESSSQRVDTKERDSENSLNRGHERGTERNKEYELVKERGREFEKSRERGSERDKEHRSRRDREREPEIEKEREKVTDSQNERSADVANWTLNGSTEGEYSVKGDPENSDWKILDNFSLPRMEKDKQKQSRGGGSSERDKWQGNNDRKSSFTDDRARNSNYKDGRYREKYHEDFYKEQRRRDNSPHDDRFSRHPSRSETKHSEVRNESSLQDYYHEDGWNIDENGIEDKDSKREKRFFDKTEEHCNLKSNFSNLPQSVEQKTSSRHKLVHDGDGDKVELVNSSKVDTKHIQPKNSLTPTFHGIKDEFRHDSARAESSCRSLSKERHRASSASSGELVGASGATERVLMSKSVSSRAKLNFAKADEMLGEDAAAASHYERTRSDGHASPVFLPEKSLLSRDQKHSKRKTGGHSSDSEDMGQKRSHPRERRGYSGTVEREPDLVLIKPSTSDNSPIALPNPGPRAILSSNNKNDQYLNGSPSHPLPPPPVRHGIDSPSVLGSFEDCSRAQAGDRKSSSRYKRTGDPSMGRGQGNAWKGVTNWPLPANGFLPFQHGPSPTGFHPVMQQFPSPSMFGVRPFMDLNHTGVPFHMHEASDRFSAHSLRFESCPPHFQGWDGSNSVFGDEPHMYGRLDWEQKRHLSSNRGWEVNDDPLREQKESLKTDSLTFLSERSPVDENQAGKADHQPHFTENRSEDNETKQLSDINVKQSIDAPRKSHSGTQIIKRQKTPELTELSNDNIAKFCSTCLSKLDISLDLARPELYRQYIDVVRSRHTTIESDNAELVHCQDIDMGIKVAVRSSKQSGKSLFPFIRDDVFKNAVLHVNLDGGFKPKTTSEIFQTKEEEDSSKTMEAEDTKVVGSHTSVEGILEENANIRNMKEVSDDKHDVPLDLMSEDPNEQPDHVQNAVTFARESSEICESLITECLNRIHGSPESTH